MALENNGQENYKILQGYFTDDNSLNGQIMPNIELISLQAIIPSTSTINFFTNSSPAPSGGANGDVWYNAPSGDLYKKVGGIWSALTDKAINVWYQPSVENLTDCPLPDGGDD